ncbi:MAG: type III PLP-dependent enzyme [Proteobacteria bacterium]|nr:type III PLP-dependent enzyme [Pseudomonadota bacterium]
MTPKIARFLDVHQPATPCLVLDIDRVEENYNALRRALPLATIYYAVKANPARPVLDRLTGLGSAFDAAGIEEIEQCLAVGAPPAAISFGNTIKKASAIARAHALGVDLFAFDSEEELRKLARMAPGTRVYCRLMVANAGADWPLSKKFGTSVEQARRLMPLAAELGLRPWGLSFHVGSQQTDPLAYAAAIGQAAMLFTDLSDSGTDLRFLNLGGGFPSRYRRAVPAVGDFADAIMEAMTRHFGNALPDMAIEPGRAIVGSAGVVSSEVVLVSKRNPDPAAARWVYLDIGRFGGLAETEGEAIRYPLRTRHDGGPTGPVVLAGPTCDGADILYESSDYQLPLALADGDRVEIDTAGAYVTTYAAQGFNGFAPLAEHYI